MNINEIIATKGETRIFIFFLSALASILAIVASNILFPSEASIISVFLLSFTLLGMVNKLFDTNRREIWEKITTPYQANKKLGISLLVIFIGIMLGYTLFSLTIDMEQMRELFARQLGGYQHIAFIFTLSDIDFGAFGELVRHNLTVLLVVLLFALFYRAGGILLIIAWNASAWGVIFSYIAKIAMAFVGVGRGLVTLLIIYTTVLLHLVTESAAYILCAMAGYFLSKACIKYFNDTKKLLRVTRAAVLIFLIAIILIIVSALIESELTPKIVAWFSEI